jgi:hypothetical protein
MKNEIEENKNAFIMKFIYNQFYELESTFNGLNKLLFLFYSIFIISNCIDQHVHLKLDFGLQYEGNKNTYKQVLLFIILIL